MHTLILVLFHKNCTELYTRTLHIYILYTLFYQLFSFIYYSKSFHAKLKKLELVDKEREGGQILRFSRINSLISLTLRRLAVMRCVEQLISLWVYASKWTRNWLHCFFFFMRESDRKLCLVMSRNLNVHNQRWRIFILVGRKTFVLTKLWDFVLRETKWLYDCEKFVRKRQGNGYKCRWRNNKIRDEDDVNKKGYFHVVLYLRAQIAEYMSWAPQSRM